FIEESAHRLPDDVFDDVGGRVINAAGFLDFRFFLNNRAMALCQADNFAEKLLIDLSENVHRQRGKDIGAFWVVKAFENVPQELVVEVEAKGEFVGRFVAVLLRFEVEEAGIVAVVGLLELLSKARVNAVAVGQGLEASVILNAAAFADAQENDAVNDALDGEVEFALGELGIAQGEVAGQVGTPAFDGLQKFVVNVGCAALGFVRFSILVERAFEDSIAREHAGDLVPTLGVFAVGNEKDARDSGAVLLVGFDAAVIHGEFLEVAEDAERQLGGPGVAAELESGADIVLDVHGSLFGFEKEFARASDAKAVIGGFRRLADLDGVFMDNVFVGFGVTLLVVDVPAEGLEERIEEFAAEPGFVVLRRAVGILVALEALGQFPDFAGHVHFDELTTERRRVATTSPSNRGKTSNIQHRTSKAEMSKDSRCHSMFGVGCSMLDVPLG